MFLTMLEHAGHTWTVDLRVIPAEAGPGLLEFSFSRLGAGDAGIRLTWRVSGDSLEVLSEKGMDVSEELLRRQLDLALAGTKAVDTSGGE
jgi:hypothetical protein